MILSKILSVVAIVSYYSIGITILATEEVGYPWAYSLSALLHQASPFVLTRDQSLVTLTIAILPHIGLVPFGIYVLAEEDMEAGLSTFVFFQLFVQSAILLLVTSIIVSVNFTSCCKDEYEEFKERRKHALCS